MTIGYPFSQFSRRRKSFKTLSTICAIGEIGIVRKISEMSYPLFFYFFPVVNRAHFEYVHDWFESKTEQIIEPISPVMVFAGKLGGEKVCGISTLGILGLTNVSNKSSSRVNESVDINGIIGKRTSRLFMQVAHGLDSIVQGLSAPLYFTTAEAI